MIEIFIDEAKESASISMTGDVKVILSQLAAVSVDIIKRLMLRSGEESVSMISDISKALLKRAVEVAEADARKEMHSDESGKEPDTESMHLPDH